MSEHKFYYPDGSPITTNCPQKTFLEYYNKQYYRKDSLKSNPIICGKNADDIDEDHPYTKRLIRSNY
ncbi:MAG: hypothetical protein IIZ51_10340, partial [Lachnospiraceae bacterium]|nr:hypothetical protein [Lachnospiraceae bacterium]